MPKRKHRRRSTRKPDPEEKIFERMPSTWSKSRKVATAKSQGMVRQAGKHLEPTGKGKRAIRKIQKK